MPGRMSGGGGPRGARRFNSAIGQSRMSREPVPRLLPPIEARSICGQPRGERGPRRSELQSYLSSNSFSWWPRFEHFASPTLTIPSTKTNIPANRETRPHPIHLSIRTPSRTSLPKDPTPIPIRRPQSFRFILCSSPCPFFHFCHWFRHCVW